MFKTLLPLLTWVWTIIVGALMLTPGGWVCISCGPSAPGYIGNVAVAVIAVVSIALGVVGIVGRVTSKTGPAE